MFLHSVLDCLCSHPTPPHIYTHDAAAAVAAGDGGDGGGDDDDE
jgi:hypothetical protein